MANKHALLTIHSTNSDVDSDGLEKCNLQAVQISGAPHQNGAFFTSAGIQKTWAPRTIPGRTLLSNLLKMC